MGAIPEGAPSPRFRLALLGGFELTGPDGVVGLPNKKLAALLAYLACAAPKPQPRERLAALLWGSHFEAQAKQNLRQALFRLRKMLGEDALESDGEVVSLNGAVLLCDVSQFEALVRAGNRDALRRAVDLYRGQLVEDIVVSEEAWSEWLTRERERLTDLVLGALMGLGEQELAADRAELALKAGQRAVTLNNMREDAHRLIMHALVATGRKAEALKHYEGLLALLKRELNTEPDGATKALAAELSSTRPTTAAREGAKAALLQPGQQQIAVPLIPNVGKLPEQMMNAESPATLPDAASPALAVRPAVPERRQLTIMVCTMVSSPPLSEDLDPEEIRDRIAPFHKLVADVAAQFDGFVAQHLGDGLHIYFGYPAAHEHDAEQAVRAGLAILAALGTLRTSFDVTFQARIGIATGLVVVGEQLGAWPAQQHTAIGEAPNLAARLQAVAAPGEVVIAASTRQLVAGMFDCRAHGATELKGLPPSVDAWRVQGERAGVSRFEARHGSALTPLVGRKEELELLLRRWNQAKLGQGRVVLLSGEPGIGKSRITQTLLAKLEGEPHARLRYFCSPHHMHSPLFPFIVQLEHAAGFEPGSSAAAKLAKLAALVKPTTNNLTRDLALLADLLSVPTEGFSPALSISPQQKREMTLTALLNQLEGAAAESPVLVVLEDAHWIDPTSLDLLDRMIVRVADLPVLLVISFRSEFQARWVGQPHVTLLPLSRLDRIDSAAIIGGVATGEVLPAVVVEQILSRTDGVPLFIEELTRMTLERGVLREATARSVLHGPRPGLTLPTTLHASLAARLDMLGSAKEVALIGAAIGREFTHEVLAAVSTFETTEFETALERLTASGLINRHGIPPDASYSFKHALVQDAAYMTMPKSRRRQLHARIGKVLTEHFPEIAKGRAEVVAQHFTEAGLASEALNYWVKAGRIAYARWANREAVEFFEQALRVLGSLPESRSTLEQAFDIRLELPQALIQLREIPRALERLEECEPLAERLNDDRRRCRMLSFKAVTYALTGELEEAVSAGTRALEFARRLGDLSLRIPASTILQQVQFYRGEYENVVELARANLAAVPDELESEDFGLAAKPSVYDRGRLIFSLCELGGFEEAAKLQVEGMLLAAQTEHAYSIGWAHLASSWIHMLKGNWAQAQPLLEHATGVLKGGNVMLLIPIAISLSAWNLAQLGEASEAVSRLGEGEELLERHATGGLSGILGWFYPWLGRAALVLGRLDDARRLSERALEFSPRQPGFAAHALHLLGDIATHPDRFQAKTGEIHYRKALAIAEPRGMRPLVAHCQLGLGKLYLRDGKRKRAYEHLTTATATYREMDMRFWLEQAEAEMHQME